MAKSMIHWNGDLVCAIDTETSGLDPHWNEILQIAVLPLDSNFERRSDVMPFYITLKPDYPERVSPDALRVCKLNIGELMLRGLDQEKAREVFLEWVDGIGLPHTEYGTRKRIIPLGHNYQFDKAFISKWLGVDTYNDIFSCFSRDTMVVAAFLNDNAAMKVSPAQFQKLELGYICAKLGIERHARHDALEDCLLAAKVYQAICRRGEWFL